MSLRNRVCVVTGGAEGIGRAVCTAILNCMGKVSILDVNEKKGELLMRDIERHYGPKKALFYYCDVTSKEQMERAFNKTFNTFGHIDAVVNNAGLALGVETDLAMVEKMIDVNVKGVVIGSFLGVTYMGTSSSGGRGKGGVIINVASMAGLYPYSGSPVYSATKHAVVALSRSLEMLLSKEGIRINCVCPAFTDTPLVQNLLQSANRDTTFQENRNEVEKLGLLRPELVAEGIKQLIEDESKNGCVMRVTTAKGIDYKVYRRAKM